MQMRERDEEKRTRDFRIVLLVSTVVILLVIGIFIIRSIYINPLEGDWVSNAAGYQIDIDDDNELTIETTVNEVFVEVEASYSMDKDAKTITFKPNLNSYAEAAEETNNMVAAADIDAQLLEIMTSFDYSLDKDTLTLTERESGEQFIFTRVK